jgi:RNA polymerase sigma factor (sigma-70 family)
MLTNNALSRDSALQYIYKENREKVCSFILSNNGNSEEAKDVFQESMIAFYENVRDGKFKAESKISTYIYSIARFKWLNQLKKDQIRKLHYGKLKDDFKTSFTFEKNQLATIIEGEHKLAIENLLTSLGAICKKILIESIYYNLSMKEITKNGNFSSEQVVRNKKSKCLKKLKDLLKTNPKLINVLKNE